MKITINGAGLFTIAIVFTTLKLTGVIDWSWWWVLSPLWIPLAILLVGFLILILAVGEGNDLS